MNQDKDRPLTEEALYEWATCLPIDSDGRIGWRSLGDVFAFARVLALAGMIEPGETVLHCTMRLLAGIQLGLDPLRSLAQLSRYGRTIKPNLAYAMARLYERFPEARITVQWYVGGEVVQATAGRPKVKRGQDATVLVLFRRDRFSEADTETFSLAEAEAEGLLDAGAESWWVVNTAHAMQQRALAWLLRRVLPGAYDLRDDERLPVAEAQKVKAPEGIPTPIAGTGDPSATVKVTEASGWKPVEPTGKGARGRARKAPEPKLQVPQEEAERAVSELEKAGKARASFWAGPEPSGEMAALDLANAELDEDPFDDPAKVLDGLAELTADLDEGQAGT